MISIRSKPASRFQGFFSSSIRKRRIRCSLYVAARSLTRMHSCRRQHVAFIYLILLRASCSLVGRIIFSKKQMQKRNSRSPVFPLPRATFTAASRSPGFLRFPGDNCSRDAPPIDVSSALALSFTALSIGGV